MASITEIYQSWQEEENKITLARANNKAQTMKWFVCINGWGKVEEIFETIDSPETYCCPEWNKVIKIEDEFTRYIINLWNGYGNGPIPSRVSRKWTFKNLYKDFLNKQGDQNNV